MTVHRARILAFAAVLVGITALVPSTTRLQAQQPPGDLPLDELRARAEQGDAIAQHRLGVMYRTGEGVSQDDAEAVQWYRLAADQGHTDAQYSLELMYSNGEGVPEDDTEAVQWFRLAADCRGGVGRLGAAGRQCWGASNICYRPVPKFTKSKSSLRN